MQFAAWSAGVVEGGIGELVAVPFETYNFAGFAANTSRGVDQLADLLCSLHSRARNGSRMTGNLYDLQCCLTHTFVMPFRSLPESL
jgi:hypothetical protein